MAIIIEYFKTEGCKMTFGQFKWLESDRLFDAVGAFRDTHPAEEYTIFKLSIEEEVK